MFVQIIRQLKKMNDIRNGVARLRAMDEHQLNDLGLTRSQIINAVRTGQI